MPKKSPSDILAAVGHISGVMINLRKLVLKKGGKDEDILRLDTPAGEDTLDQIADLVVKAGKPVETVAPAKPQPLLKFLNTVSVPDPDNDEFLVSDRFKVGTLFRGLKISYVGDNFKSYFGDMTVKAEQPSELRRHVLVRNANNTEIVNELGGEEQAETMLGRVYALLKKQGKGESGTLLTDGTVYIFFVRDRSGLLREVGIHWDGGGWYIGASPVGCQYGWNEGLQVFSGNSSRLAA